MALAARGGGFTIWAVLLAGCITTAMLTVVATRGRLVTLRPLVFAATAVGVTVGVGALRYAAWLAEENVFPVPATPAA